MEILENYDLKNLNTFGVAARARYFVWLESAGDIIDFIRNKRFNQHKLLILNGGSNILFTGDFDGLVIKINNSGYKLIREENNVGLFRVNAGENWDQFVQETLRLGYGGIENLSMIPGNTGAAPIQNIGAYGVEQKEAFESLEAIHISTGKIRRFSAAACEFDYRFSIFKGKLKGQYLILSVDYRLNKNRIPKTDYGAIRLELKKMGEDKNPSPGMVARAVRNIRSSKLPDPEKLGNAGSFFKNPVVSKKKIDELTRKFPDLAAWPIEDGSYKLAAGWLIDKLGWKGVRRGDAGVCETQALVLVNYGNATGTEIYDLAMDICNSVSEKYGIMLEPEVNIV